MNESDTTDLQIKSGLLDFKAAPRRSKARFLHAYTKDNAWDDSKFDRIYTELRDKWGVYKPRLLFSVTGGKKGFYVTPHIAKLFDHCLLKLAEIPGAWVITAGSSVGIPKHVAGQLRGTSQVCLGITGWSHLREREDLLGFGSPQSHFKDENQETVFHYDLSESRSGKGVFLDNNHTHFILVGNETGDEIRYTEDEAQFRAKLTRYIATKEKIKSVLVMVEGGVSALKHVYCALQNSIPVLVLNGSGRASDCLVYALENKEKILSDNNHLHSYLTERLEGRNSEEEILDMVTYIVKCSDFSDKIKVYDVDSTVSLDEEVMDALLEIKLQRKEELSGDEWFSILRDTVLWRRVDIAEQILLKCRKVLKQHHYQDAIVMALALDRVNFVALLLRYDVNMHQAISPKVLKELYGFTLQRKKSQLNIMKELFDDADYADNDYSSVFNCLELYDLYQYEQKLVNRKQLMDLVNKTLCDSLSVGREELLTEFFADIQTGDDITTTKEPFKELFYWAILNGMLDMACYLWQYEKDGLIKAVVAASMLSELSNEAKRQGLDKEIINGYERQAKVFRDKGVMLLNECYHSNPSKTQHLVSTTTSHISTVQSNGKRRSWQNCLKLAVSSENRPFVAHAAVQSLLDDFWLYRLQEMTFWQAVCYYFLPPLIVYWNFLEFKSVRQSEEIVQISNFKDIPFENQQCIRCKAIDTKPQDKDRTDSVINRRNRMKKNPQSLSLVIHENGNNYGTNHDDVIFTNVIMRTGSLGGKHTAPYKTKEEQLSACKKLQGFYKAPVVIFYKSVIWQIMFTLLLTYTAIRNYQPEPDVIEYVLFVYVTAKFFEELRQLYAFDSYSQIAKLRLYLRSNWNRLDIVVISFFYVAIIIRWIDSSSTLPRLFYALDAALWIIRTMHSFYAHNILGPYVIMLYRMANDMAYFLLILLMFFLAYGVAKTALLTPTENIWEMLTHILYKPYFNIHGSLFLKDPPDINGTRFGTPILNDFSEPLSMIFLAMFLLVANVLLLNVLIAIFNNTFAEIQANAEEIWRYQRYGLVMEYANRSYFLPPFNILEYAYKACLYLYYSIKNCLLRNTRDKNAPCSCNHECPCHSVPVFKSKKYTKPELTLFEVECMARLVRKLDECKEVYNAPDEQAQDLAKSMKKMEENLYEMQKLLEQNLRKDG